MGKTLSRDRQGTFRACAERDSGQTTGSRWLTAEATTAENANVSSEPNSHQIQTSSQLSLFSTTSTSANIIRATKQQWTRSEDQW